MKKYILIILLVVVIVVAVVYITYNLTNNEENQTNQNEQSNIVIQENENFSNTNNIENVTTNNTVENLQNEGEDNTMENARIKLTVDGNEIFVNLDESQASREFLEMLPLTLTFEDFNNTEKIATLPDELSTEGLPFGYTPEVGDFSYYAPWGNISVFYKDFRYSNSLYKLGRVESGIEILENMNGNFEVTIERVN